MGSYVDISQFINLIANLDRDDINPIEPTESSGLFDKAGNRITGVKVKMYIEDDGGTWLRDSLIEPAFLWDMKKISGSSVIDDGNYSQHSNLAGFNVKETDSGIQFLGKPSSFLRSINLISSDPFDGNESLLNVWFIPEEDQNTTEKIELITIRDFINTDLYEYYTATGGLIYGVYLAKTPNNKFQLSIEVGTATSTKVHAIGTNIEPGTLNNIQISIIGTTMYIFYQGKVYTYTSAKPVPRSTQCFVTFGLNFRGQILYSSLVLDDTDELSTNYSAIMSKQYELKFPLPRGKEYVDFSDHQSFNGLDLLMEVNKITKVVENLRGQLFVKTNSIKVKNG